MEVTFDKLRHFAALVESELRVFRLSVAGVRVDGPAGVVTDEGGSDFRLGFEVVEGEFLSHCDVPQGKHSAFLKAEVGGEGVIEVKSVGVLHVLVGTDFDTVARAVRGGFTPDGVNQFPAGKGEECVGGTFTVCILTHPKTVAAIAHEWRIG
jgi:hypothetical protein